MLINWEVQNWQGLINQLGINLSRKVKNKRLTLMRTGAKGSPMPNIRMSVVSPQRTAGLDAMRQLVLLTKENKLLRQELEQSKKQIESISNLKTKYKNKYKTLKQELYSQKPLTLGPQQMRRSESGKIYNQTKRINQSPQLNMHQSKSSHTNYLQDDPYGIKIKSKAEFSKISTGIQSILNLLLSMKARSDQQYAQVYKNTEKLESVALLISQQIRENKDVINKLNYLPINGKAVAVHPRNQVPISYTQDDNIEYKEAASGKGPPEKDSQKYQQRQMKESEGRDVTSQKKRQYKNSPFAKETEKLPTCERKGTFVVEEKQSSEDDESTKSKWEMLNQIGRKLENWKLCQSDYSDDGNFG